MLMLDYNQNVPSDWTKMFCVAEPDEENKLIHFQQRTRNILLVFFSFSSKIVFFSWDIIQEIDGHRRVIQIKYSIKTVINPCSWVFIWAQLFCYIFVGYSHFAESQCIDYHIIYKNKTNFEHFSCFRSCRKLVFLIFESTIE